MVCLVWQITKLQNIWRAFYSDDSSNPRTADKLRDLVNLPWGHDKMVIYIMMSVLPSVMMHWSNKLNYDMQFDLRKFWSFTIATAIITFHYEFGKQHYF